MAVLQERFPLCPENKDKSLNSEHFGSGKKKKKKIKGKLLPWKKTSPLLACPCCPFSLIVSKRVTKCIMLMNAP